MAFYNLPAKCNFWGRREEGEEEHLTYGAPEHVNNFFHLKCPEVDTLSNDKFRLSVFFTYSFCSIQENFSVNTQPMNSLL
jgi:hypothetical protein